MQLFIYYRFKVRIEVYKEKSNVKREADSTHGWIIEVEGGAIQRDI